MSPIERMKEMAAAESAAARKRWDHNKPQSNAGPNPQVLARRERVVRMKKSGMNVAAIARALDMPRSSVSSDLVWARTTGLM